MSGTNQAQPPRIKELRTIAIRWWYLFRDTQISIGMKIPVLL
jgi:hypothetical protein